MTTPSLGRLLRAQQCETADCVKELERQASGKGPCAQQDLQLVRDFFHQASTGFAGCILAGLSPLPLAIGNGQHDKIAAILHTYRWKEGYDIRDATHPYHGVWQPFQRWCDSSELRPEFSCHRDPGGKEKWYTLTVRPAEHLHMAAPHGTPPAG
ncbi:MULTISPECIES: hypothetical protein [Duganella]|uniref:hypothetical protein n=1 Tax=Duganella TaxID=75654 RepID=UPI0030E7E3AF